jgi:putative peptidoglycan lipid II flippase
VKAAAQPESDASAATATQPAAGRGAALVASGILASRLFGLVRQKLVSYFLGTTVAADAFAAAFKIPNILQNLFGEGALSASFIPVYARLVAEGKDEEAGRVAGAVAAILGLAIAVLVLVGVTVTPALMVIIAPSWTAEKREMTIVLTRILFPGAGIFVFSSWCLGVLNSHRRFLLPYAAPVLWNVAMIVALLRSGIAEAPASIAVTLAWASVVGALLQFLIQLPTAIRLARPLRVRLDAQSQSVRRVIMNFAPVFVSRGVVQISGYIDLTLATLLPEGMTAAMTYAQTAYLLPISLFGMSVSAAELPEMSRATGSTEEIAAILRTRVSVGLRQIAFFIVPSAAAFLAFGDLIAGILFEGGRFSRTASIYSWGILAGAAVGLLASSMGRLYSSAFYALNDTRTPLRFAVVRVVLTTVLGYLFAFPLPHALGIDASWGAAGLTASAGIAGWVEFSLLRSRMNRRIGETGLPLSIAAKLWGAAAAAVVVGWGIRLATAGSSRYVVGLLTLGTFGMVYLGAATAMGISETRILTARLRRKR